MRQKQTNIIIFYHIDARARAVWIRLASACGRRWQRGAFCAQLGGHDNAGGENIESRALSRHTRSHTARVRHNGDSIYNALARLQARR